MNTRVLTGITTTGTPHLGNYAGAIRPAVQASTQPGVDAFFFLADYHALIKCDDPARVARSRLEIAATWLAVGLDHERVTFYRQSDIPEIPELSWLLTCVTAKGLMNRAHAYKASVDQNVAKGVDPDDGVTMGLFSYPVLMAADILMFNANKVPVGRDQIQHLEMARDIAQRFNHLYGREYFALPEVTIEEDVATLPGLDGRKMSKSYNNTIPLFEGGANALRASVMRIVTDSRAPGEAKDAESSHLYTLYRAFATHAESAAFRKQLEEGMGWGDAKQALYEHLEALLAPMREKYFDLIANPGRIEDILQAGAARARKLAVPMMQELREAVGLRNLNAGAAAGKAQGKKEKGKGARFVSFRDEDGGFRFRLLAADGEELLLSQRFADPKEAGALMRRLQSEPADSVLQASGEGYAAMIDGVAVAAAPAGAQADSEAQLVRARDALASLSQE
ncbi:tryptophan--tRNA ligase [Achromobacter sp. UMC46]|uniref:tryptophan--tRNA ligase n=1 Tax=Achromobacter sp. UMC46 TaxID=1862319 RepID=UPI0015FF9BCF|nr:tryptophan--tRNA ligase [Achromobacter sp. UMC46]MBB1597253.1 tryptophan--tRNA ligase [Achromobacter sp. UMC46]